MPEKWEIYKNSVTTCAHIRGVFEDNPRIIVVIIVLFSIKTHFLNSFALRTAKTLWSFGCSECKRVR